MRTKQPTSNFTAIPTFTNANVLGPCSVRRRDGSASILTRARSLLSGRIERATPRSFPHTVKSAARRASRPSRPSRRRERRQRGRHGARRWHQLGGARLGVPRFLYGGRFYQTPLSLITLAQTLLPQSACIRSINDGASCTIWFAPPDFSFIPPPPPFTSPLTVNALNIGPTTASIRLAVQQQR